MKIWVRNLATEEDIEFELPMDDYDLEEAIEEYIGDNDYIITDCDIVSVNEHIGLSTLNEFAQAMENSDLDEDAISAMIKYFSDFDEVISILENENYMVYYNCTDMGNVAYQYLEETGMISELPDWAQMYFNYDNYGRDMEINGTFIEYNDGYIEIYY